MVRLKQCWWWFNLSGSLNFHAAGSGVCKAPQVTPLLVLGLLL